VMMLAVIKGDELQKCFQKRALFFPGLTRNSA